MTQHTLVLIRHAKTKPADFNTNDFDRVLTERGEHDATAMGTRLETLDIIPDLIISSTAKRAKQTARRIAAAIGYDKDKIAFVEKLYHCTPPVFEDVVYGIDDAVKTVFIVAHNPGITDFANQLSPSFTTDHMPTCGVVAAYINTGNWNDFSNAEKKVFLFESPKKES